MRIIEHDLRVTVRRGGVLLAPQIGITAIGELSEEALGSTAVDSIIIGYLLKPGVPIFDKTREFLATWVVVRKGRRPDVLDGN